MKSIKKLKKKQNDKLSPNTVIGELTAKPYDRRLMIPVAIIIFALVASLPILIYKSLAATRESSVIESDVSTLSGGAQKVTDSSASGGFAVKFNAAPPANSVIPSGVAIRLSSSTINSTTTYDRKGAKILAMMATWKHLEPTPDVYNETAFNIIKNNAQHAKDNNYKLILRVMTGQEAPSWLWTNKGVKTVKIVPPDPLSSSYCSGEIPVPLLWDPILKNEYTQLVQRINTTMQQPLNGGGTVGDQIIYMPVAMATTQGTEISFGYGSNTSSCPDLVARNQAAWNAVEPDLAIRRQKTKDAWRTAIDIHMANLSIPSAVAYGTIFLDSQVNSKAIVEEKVAQYPNKLWTMETNLRSYLNHPTLGTKTYPQWCPACDSVIKAGVARSSLVGMQSAGTEHFTLSNPPLDAFKIGVEYAISTYKIKFLEVSPQTFTNLPGAQNYLINSVQPRL